MSDESIKRDKILDKVAAALKLAESEKNLNNLEAAENATGIASKLMLQYGISMEAVQARQEGTDKIGKIAYAPEMMGDIKFKKENPWVDRLAGIVAHAFNCRVLIMPDEIKEKYGTNTFVFVGYTNERDQAVHYFSLLQNALYKAVDKEYRKMFHRAYRNGTHAEVSGTNWRKNFIIGALHEIITRMTDIRAQVIKEAPDSSMALVRINQALAKIDDFLSDSIDLGAPKPILDKDKLNRAGLEAGRDWARSLEILNPLGQGKTQPKHVLPKR